MCNIVASETGLGGPWASCCALAAVKINSIDFSIA
jgi:hypothetical protein